MREISLHGTVYDFSADFSLTENEDILNIHEDLKMFFHQLFQRIKQLMLIRDALVKVGD